MRSFTAKPHSSALRRFVESFHYQEAELPFTLERIMPNGQAHLMVNLAEDEFRSYGGVSADQICEYSGAVVAGPHAKSVVIDTQAQRWLAAVDFRQGGASRFFPMPMTEISNQVVQLQDVWRKGGFLRERLLDVRTLVSKFRALEEVLLDYLNLEFDEAIAYAMAALRADASVSHVALRLGLSLRTLERRFSAQVGITPKRFARVHRLQGVLRAVRLSSKPDQAHLIHDFQDIAGITPTEYRPHSPQRNNHVPIAAL